MADVDTPTCRAISARVIPQSSTNFARNLCSDGRNLTPAAPAAQFGQGNFTFFAFFCNQALTLPAGAATFVADSFEKRDDWISVSRGSSLTSFSISLGMTEVGSSPMSFRDSL
jgi:hypothetical protein